MPKCQSCGTNNEESTKFCANCGSLLKKNSKQKNLDNLIPCKDCGKKISKNAEFCPSCGLRSKVKTDLSITKGITKFKNPSTAAALGVLFGPFGYLYLRRYGLFFMWLLASMILVQIHWAFAPLLWISWAVHMYQIAAQINRELGK